MILARKQYVVSAFVGVTMGLGLGYGEAASFDCAKASTKIENAICASPRLSLLDEDLGKLYQEALKRSPESQQAQIRDEQRRWLRETRNACQDEKCMRRVYAERLEAFEKAKEEYEAVRAEVEGEDKRRESAMQASKAVTPAAPTHQPPALQTSQGDSNKRAQALYIEARKNSASSSWVSTGVGDRDWGFVDVSSNVMPAHSENKSIFVAFLYKRKQANGVNINYVNVVDAASCDPSVSHGVGWLYAMQEHFPDRFEGSGGFDKKNTSSDFSKFGNLSCAALIKILPTLEKRMRSGR